MNAPPIIRIVAQNVTDEARALAPGCGRRREVQVDENALRTWLDHFAGLSGFDAEDADARLYLTVPGRRVEVRWFGGKLGSEIGGTFLPATVDEIMGQTIPTSAPTAPVAVASEPELPAQTPPTRRPGNGRTQGVLLVGLLAAIAVINWWNFRPKTPEGTEWIENAAERQAILQKADGKYASENEGLSLDAAARRLTGTDETGAQTLNTVLRVGRRAGVPVLVTEGGLVLEIAATGHLQLGAIVYRRLPAGG